MEALSPSGRHRQAMFAESICFEPVNSDTFVEGGGAMGP